MAKNCRDCRWYKVDMGNPMKGLCIEGSYETAAGESTSGTASYVVKATMHMGTDEACDKFEGKPSRAQRLKEGY